jgi:hypothetical protein
MTPLKITPMWNNCVEQPHSGQKRLNQIRQMWNNCAEQPCSGQKRLNQIRQNTWQRNTVDSTLCYPSHNACLLSVSVSMGSSHPHS